MKYPANNKVNKLGIRPGWIYTESDSPKKDFKPKYFSAFYIG